MKDWLFVLACFSPLAGATLLVVAIAANAHFVVIAALAGYTASSLVSPGYYRGIREIWTHGVHNDR